MHEVTRLLADLVARPSTTPPGDTSSDYALKRITLDSDVANACLFMASDVSRQITGVDLPVDGGWAAL